MSRLYGETPSMTTISTNPEGLDVEVDGMMFTTPQSFDWTPGTSHTISVPPTQGDDTERFRFAKWSDGGGREHTIAASSATTVFTAHFIQEFQVATGARPPAGGTVIIAPPSADGFYIARTPIEVTAVPAEGYAFGTWWGDFREEYHGLSGNPALLPSVPFDLNYTAVFRQSPLTTIDTSTPGRWAVVDGDRVRIPHNFGWESGSTHTIAIEDEPQPSRSGATRWVFSQWSDGGAATHEITVPDEPSTFKADFKQQFLLTTRPSFRSRGSVEVTPTSDDDFYDSGSSVQLTAIPRVGYQFIAWLDEQYDRISHDNSMTLTMDDQGWALGFFSELPLESTTEMPTTNLISGAPPTEFSLPRVSDATLFTGGPAFTAEVPEGSASLTVKLETRTPDVDIDLYVRHGAKPELSDTMIVSDYSSTLPTGEETIVITPQSKPPLQSGTYLITFVLFETDVEVTSTISAVVATAGTESFSIPNLGGWSVTSSGTAETLGVGYGRIRAGARSTTPSGVAIFQFRDSEGVLISEAGVPAAAPVREGRIFAEVNGPVNTGLAIANPNGAPATIRFYFTDTSGTRSADGSFDLGAHRQTAKFLDQAPFNGGPSVLGTFTFESSMPVAVVALRGFTNEAGEFLMTTLPVAPLVGAPSPFSRTPTDTVYFPHFADGNGWETQVILVNPTDRAITGMVEFLEPGSGAVAASPVVLTLEDGSTGSDFDYSIPPRSVQKFTTSNPTGRLAVGSVRATPSSGNAAPSGLVVFSYAQDGKTVSEAGVPALPKGTAFRAYVEASGTPGQAGSIRSGLAITNTAATSSTVTLEVTRLDGSLALAPSTLSLPPSGQVARFLDQIFSLPDNFSGVLRVTSTTEVAMVALRLRVNERGELKMTTTSPSNEMDPSTSQDKFFAHLADSGGWSTQFILFSGTAGQNSSGTLSLTDASGEPLERSP